MGASRRSGWLRAAGMTLVAIAPPAAALACDVGDIQCDAAGYRYVCQCYTSDGCQYYPSGSCSAYRGAPAEDLRRWIAYGARPGPFTSQPARHANGAP